MSNDLVRLAMERAVRSFGGSDGTFNAAGFGVALHRLAYSGRAEAHTGSVDGDLVRAILCGRGDVRPLKGGAHYRLLTGEGEPKAAA